MELMFQKSPGKVPLYFVFEILSRVQGVPKRYQKSPKNNTKKPHLNFFSNFVQLFMENIFQKCAGKVPFYVFYYSYNGFWNIKVPKSSFLIFCIQKQLYKETIDIYSNKYDYWACLDRGTLICSRCNPFRFAILPRILAFHITALE